MDIDWLFSTVFFLEVVVGPVHDQTLVDRKLFLALMITDLPVVCLGCLVGGGFPFITHFGNEEFEGVRGLCFWAR